MNKKTEKEAAPKGKAGLLSKLNGRTKDVLLLCALAAALVFAAWKIFYTGDSDEVSATGMSETETKVMRILEEIDGVGEASVMVCETEDGAQSAVVVCEGAERFTVVMDVREAVATALGIPQNSVKVYLKKE